LSRLFVNFSRRRVAALAPEKIPGLLELATRRAAPVYGVG
jgi:hypothetical protein